MTLAQAEADKRFDQFKFCGMIELGIYISRAAGFLAKSEDAEVREFYNAARLINNARIGRRNSPIIEDFSPREYKIAVKHR